MKRIKMNGLALLILLFGFSGWASAAVYHDTYNANTWMSGSLFGAKDTVTWTHYIDDNGFNSEEESVVDATLDLVLWDGRYDPWYARFEFAVFNEGPTTYFWEVDTGTTTHTVGFESLAHLNDYGYLTLSLTAVIGDYYFHSADLWAYTEPVVSGVPNPATVWLFGSALLCMIGFSRWPVRTLAEVTA